MRLVIRVCATDTVSGAGPESMVIAKIEIALAHLDACVHVPHERPTEWMRRRRSTLVDLIDEGVVARASACWIHFDPIPCVGDVVRLILLVLRRHPSFGVRHRTPITDLLRQLQHLTGGTCVDVSVSR